MPTLTNAAEEWVRLALSEATSQELADSDTRPAHLVAIARCHQIPVELLVWWIHDKPRGKEWNAAAFSRWAAKYRATADELARQASAESERLCPQCASHISVRAGGLWLCTSGRCDPQAA